MSPLPKQCSTPSRDTLGSAASVQDAKLVPHRIMEHYNRLTNPSGIQAQADSLSVSGRTLTIHTSTTMGLGVVSGRAIMAVGEFVLKGIETIQIHRTLFAASIDVRNLQRNQSNKPLRNRTIAVLLELQR